MAEDTKKNSAGEDQPVNKKSQYQSPKGGKTYDSKDDFRTLVSRVKSAKEKPDTIPLPDEQLPRSLSAKWANYEIELANGEKVKFLEGSKLHHKEIFAGKGTKFPIREVEGLVRKYGGKAEEWQKIKAFGTIVHDDGKTEEIEIHWYEEPTVGKVKLKEKVR